MMVECIKSIENRGTGPIEVWFEPWGMAHSLPPGQSFRVVAISDQPGQVEIVREEKHIAVYGWVGCTMQVYRGDDLVDDFSIKFPEMLPPGMSTKEFIGFMFGGPGGP